jgi:hypothetical protein
MTLHELSLAIEGFNELKHQEFQEYLYGVRLICFWSSAPHLPKKAKIKRPEDILTLDVDKKIRKNRIAKFKPIQKVIKSE